MNAASDVLLHTLDSGGFVAPPLFVIAIVVWFALGERVFLLRRGSRAPLRQVLTMTPTALSPALVVAAARLRELTDQSNRTSTALAEATLDVERSLGRHHSLIKTLVVIAPLLGLLGTVSGMIETFDSLATMSLHAAGGGGVAGGIAEALVSTEIGLLVAIPGLLVGRLLDRAQRNRLDDIHALRDLVAIGDAP